MTVGAPPIDGSMLSAVNLMSEVATFLGQISDDLQNNQMLRMMIGLMILMAILEQNQQGGTEKSTGLQGSMSTTNLSMTFEETRMVSSQSTMQYSSVSIAYESSSVNFTDPTTRGSNFEAIA